VHNARESKSRKSFAYRFVAAIARPLVLLFTKRVWRGTENLKTTSGLIVCCNHISNFDPLVLALFLNDNGRPPRFLAKAQVFKVPVFGAILKSAGQIPVHRGTSVAANSLRDAEAAVKAGETAVIYPEGTHTYDPQLWPMTGATGAARLALTTRVPLIPVAQWGAQNIISIDGKGLKLIPRQTTYVTAGSAVDFDDLYELPMDSVTLNSATERIMDAITDLLEDLRGEKAPKLRWDRRRQPGSTPPESES
jgi:1-acyl-sn-glycerol-3-phosphate acyltransferase